MALPVKHTASTNGQGKLTVGILRSALENLPEGAEVKVSTYDDQRDGAGWSFMAVWSGDPISSRRIDGQPVM